LRTVTGGRAIYTYIAVSKRNIFPTCLGNIFRLKKKLDENWFEGEVGGKVGLFPVSYVEVLIPLP
jgi:hypothetical protein